MINKLRTKLLLFKKQKAKGEITFLKIRGAGVASVDINQLMHSKKIAKLSQLPRPEGRGL
jgi:hypothetical protein